MECSNEDVDVRRIEHLKGRLEETKNRINDLQYMCSKQKPELISKSRKELQLIRDIKVKNEKCSRKKKKGVESFIEMYRNALFLKGKDDEI